MQKTSVLKTEQLEIASAAESISNHRASIEKYSPAHITVKQEMLTASTWHSILTERNYGRPKYISEKDTSKNKPLIITYPADTPVVARDTTGRAAQHQRTTLFILRTTFFTAFLVYVCQTFLPALGVLVLAAATLGAVIYMLSRYREKKRNFKWFVKLSGLILLYLGLGLLACVLFTTEVGFPAWAAIFGYVTILLALHPAIATILKDKKFEKPSQAADKKHNSWMVLWVLAGAVIISSLTTVSLSLFLFGSPIGELGDIGLILIGICIIIIFIRQYIFPQFQQKTDLPDIQKKK
jgi:hypothetical protein